MADELVLYTNPQSRGRIARWMLEEIGQPYRTEVLDYATTMKAPAYRAINPMGKVPALQHGDVVVTESAAICAYLADAFPAAQLAPPPAHRLRGPYFEVPAERERMIGYGRIDLALNALEGALSGAQYLAGDRFTAADLYVGSLLGFFMMFATIERRPAFERYWAQISARPACARAKALDDAMVGTPR